MSEDKTKADNPPPPAEEQKNAPSFATEKNNRLDTSKNTVITITFPVIKEHKITIEGIPDLNNDGVIDMKDVLIAIKQLMEREDFKNF